MDNYSARALVQKAVADAKPVRTVAQLTELIEAVPHPLLGERVKRRAYGPYRGAWRTERGTMCQHTGTSVLYVGVGQYRATVEPGGTYVRTLSGRGAYPDKVDKHHEAWELDE